jgi:glucokinase
MYLGVDIGGSKTLVASLDNGGTIVEHIKFLTPDNYDLFIKELENTVASLTTKDFAACGVGVPGRINREHGIGITFGNLPWENVPIQADVEAIVHCPTVIDNDANLGGLSEAMLLPDYDRVLYVTISTGIGTGLIDKQAIDPGLADSEGGEIMLEHHGEMMKWEDFASGKAIVKRFHKKAAEITDEATWKTISHDLAAGLIQLIAIAQPEVIVLGGSVGTYFHHYEKFLIAALKKYENPMVPIPPIREAARPEEAVIYGCYDLAKQTYGSNN